MIDRLFQSTTVPVLEQVVAFTQARHGILAGNVANLDTPGYKTRDLSPALFEEKLQDAIERRAEPVSAGSATQSYGYTNSPGHVGGAGDAGKPLSMDEFRDVRESMKSILYHDESDVAIEKQVTEIAKNQAKHNLALSLLISQFQLLEAAISERA
jgi:flagellar basal-body rod protein FlgB